MRRAGTAVLLLLFAPTSFAAKDNSFQMVTWPDSGAPVIRFTFSKFKQLTGGIGKEHTYLTDVSAENLSTRRLGSIDMHVYVFDKSHVRIGDGTIDLANVTPQETIKFELTLQASGVPASISLVAEPPRNLSLTVNSVPQGATVSIDGKELGTTPTIAEMSIGKHILTYSKEGYSTGHYPLELGPRDANGGSVSYELGASSHDTVELRDGSVLSGDLLSVDARQVQIRIGGQVQTYDRNQIRRLVLTQREPVAQQ